MQVPQPNEGDSGKPIKLLDRVRNRMRVLHLLKRTEEVYVSWISRYVYFHRERRGGMGSSRESNRRRCNPFPDLSSCLSFANKNQPLSQSG